jgi:NAD(P)-dependent dehydrogenase (short-subunit alcohol dehydrogenase family)
VSKILQDKVALITGATGGLGTSVTQAFLDSGAKVIGVSRSIEQSAFKSPAFEGISAELANPNAVSKLIQQVVQQFGRIDVLAHRVGGFAGGQAVFETTDQTFESMLSMNLTSAFYVLRAVIPHMRQAESGRITAIASRAAESPGPMVGAYSASKAALVSLIRTVAPENKDRGITANAILPGTIDTPANRKAMPQADTRTWVQPASIASLILWLAGSAGQEVTGAAIPAYGAGL